MEKLTIKEKKILQAIKQHVAYGAPIEILNYQQDYVGIQYSKANGYYMLAGDIYVTYDGGSTGRSVKDFCFLLRPLSSLTEEIEHNGERFVPIERLRSYGFVFNEYYEGDFSDWSMWSYEVATHLFEWHLDVFGLIDRGLALPIEGRDIKP